MSGTFGSVPYSCTATRRPVSFSALRVWMMPAVVGCTAGSVDLSEGMFRHLVITGRSRLALYFARIPAGLAILPQTGHTANLEEPEAFNAAVDRFLAAVDRGAWRLRDPRSVSESTTGMK